jgi:hypothetical protein
MSIHRIVSSAALIAVLCIQPALAQNKAAMAKAAADFEKQTTALSASLADLTTRMGKASPNDKEMLKSITAQIGLVDANADSVLALGTVAGEVRDAGDMAIAKKHMATRCKSLITRANGAVPYIASLVNNIASPATAAEVTKAKELIASLPHQGLCLAK